LESELYITVVTSR